MPHLRSASMCPPISPNTFKSAPEEPAKALRARQHCRRGRPVPHPGAHVEQQCKCVEHKGIVAASHETAGRGQGQQWRLGREVAVGGEQAVTQRSAARLPLALRPCSACTAYAPLLTLQLHRPGVRLGSHDLNRACRADGRHGSAHAGGYRREVAVTAGPCRRKREGTTGMSASHIPAHRWRSASGNAALASQVLPVRLAALPCPTAISL